MVHIMEGTASVQANCLVISVTINVCFVLFLTLRAGIRFHCSKGLHQKGEKLISGFRKQIITLQKMDIDVMSKMITNSIFGLCRLASSCYFLLGTTVLRYPFSSLNAPPQDVTLSTQIALLCSAGLGHTFYCMGQVLRHSDREYEHSSALVRMLYHVVTVFSYITIIWTGDNLLLGVLCVFMETDNMPREMLSFSRLMGVKMNTRIFITMSFVENCFAAATRIGIPTTCFVIGFYHQNVLVMHPASLALLFCSLLFYAIHNMWLVYRDVRLTHKGFRDENDLDQRHLNNIALKPNKIPISIFQMNLLESGLLYKDNLYRDEKPQNCNTMICSTAANTDLGNCPNLPNSIMNKTDLQLKGGPILPINSSIRHHVVDDLTTKQQAQAKPGSPKYFNKKNPKNYVNLMETILEENNAW